MEISEPRPLPSNPFPASTLCSEAYDKCLIIEAAAGTDETRLVYPRVLGYLIAEIRTEQGQKYIAQDVKDCFPDREKMDDLGWFYIKHLICLFRQDKGRTPTPSPSSSQASLTRVMPRNFYTDAVTSTPQDHGAAKAAALRRDNYECMISGVTDKGYFDILSLAEQDKLGGVDKGYTNLSHIFSPYLDWNTDIAQVDHPKANFSGSLRSIVESIANINVHTELSGAKSHNLQNGLTLWGPLRHLFDMLYLWFEAVDGLNNTYDIVPYYSHDVAVQRLPSTRVTFTSTDPALALPDPRYLELHASVCRAAHFSGAARSLARCDL